MNKAKNTLLQLDVDMQPSSFDGIVALDSGVEYLMAYGCVTESQVESLVHGAIFTRKVSELKSTGIFVGGSDVERAEQLLKRVIQSMFGPMRVSTMFDPSGANTTAAAAVLAVGEFCTLSSSRIAVFGATGSVGSRICQLLGNADHEIFVISRELGKATAACERLSRQVSSGRFHPVEAKTPQHVEKILAEVDGVFAAGAPGTELLTQLQLENASHLSFAADLNAVPPVGIASIDVADYGAKRGEIFTFGAIGIGRLKMKIHRSCIGSLFESNDKILDLQEIFKIGKTLV